MLGGDRAAANYSEALMNSIWGLYNRYSVHNFKSSTSSKAGEVMFHQARSGNGKEWNAAAEISPKHWKPTLNWKMLFFTSISI